MFYPVLLLLRSYSTFSFLTPLYSPILFLQGLALNFATAPTCFWERVTSTLSTLSLWLFPIGFTLPLLTCCQATDAVLVRTTCHTLHIVCASLGMLRQGFAPCIGKPLPSLRLPLLGIVVSNHRSPSLKPSVYLFRHAALALRAGLEPATRQTLPALPTELPKHIGKGTRN